MVKLRMRKEIGSIVVALSLCLGGGLVFAQDAPPAAGSQPATQPAASAPAPKATVKMSPQEMVTKASELIRKSQDVLRRLVQLQDLARRQKDVIKLNCVNDKMLQVKQLLNIAEGANTNLQEAIARSDEEGRYHEFNRIDISHQQVNVLLSEAENCVGEDLSYVGETDVKVEKIPTPEDLEPKEPDYPPIEPPPAASPYI